jgi:GAF domain-containing protein
MTISQTPANHKNLSIGEKARGLWIGLVSPHSSLEEVGEKRRAQLFNSIMLIMLVLLLIDTLANTNKVFAVSLLLLSAASYMLGKSKYHRIGSFLFSFGLLSSAYLSLLLGRVDNSLSAILNIFYVVPIALAIASVLVNQREFLYLIGYSVIASPMALLMSRMPVGITTAIGVGGLALSVGAILYGINLFRVWIERARLTEVQEVNRDLGSIRSSLEERTQELEQTNRQIKDRADRLQKISEFAQSLAVTQKPEELYQMIAHAISERFGYYHVGVFLLDENREYAVLRAANSEGGQRMLTRGHQLRVGASGIIGHVAQGGQPRRSLDTALDAVFYQNPDLQETRSEVALPLKIGTKVIGVLDVQSERPSAFSEEDVSLLGTLANQVAVVIQNAQMNEQLRGLLTPLNALRPAGEAGMHPGYSYRSDGTITTEVFAFDSEQENALAAGRAVLLNAKSSESGPAIAVPVRLRDQVVGIIRIEPTDIRRTWSADEIATVQAISDRAALALENARLFEDATRRAELERAIADMTRKIGGKPTVDDIMRSTVESLGTALGESEITFKFAVGEDQP